MQQHAIMFELYFLDAKLGKGLYKVTINMSKKAEWRLIGITEAEVEIKVTTKVSDPLGRCHWEPLLMDLGWHQADKKPDIKVSAADHQSPL